MWYPGRVGKYNLTFNFTPDLLGVQGPLITVFKRSNIGIDGIITIVYTLVIITNI